MYRRAACFAGLAVALPALLLANSGHDPVAKLEAPTLQGTVNSDLPPERYQGNPVDGVVVFYTDRAGLDAYCGKAQPGNVIIACHRIHKESGASVIFMPNPCFLGRTEFYAKIACHEMGHANGWGGDHEP